MTGQPVLLVPAMYIQTVAATDQVVKLRSRNPGSLRSTYDRLLFPP